MLGGKTFFRSIVADDPEKLRKSLLQNQDYYTHPKMFVDKHEFSDLKQNSRLMHQFYSTDVNAPTELQKSTRFMKKSDADVKQLK